MFISIDKNGKLALREPDDFKRLHIEASDGDVTREQIDRALGSIATRDNDDFWIDVAALKQLGRAGDAAWEKQFRRDDRERAEVRLGQPGRPARALLICKMRNSAVPAIRDSGQRRARPVITRSRHASLPTHAGKHDGRGNALVG